MVERFVLDFAIKVPLFSHAVIFYNTFYDKWRILSSLIKKNLETKQSVICFSNEPRDVISHLLYEAGIDMEKTQMNGELIVSEGEEWCLKEDFLKDGSIFNAWMDRVNDALFKGFRGLCIICEPISFFGSDLRGILRYERSLPKKFSSPISVVCQYSSVDLLSLENGTLLLRLADAHSHVITPSFVGPFGFANYYNHSLKNSLDNILGKTISSVFFSFFKVRRRRYKDTKSRRVKEIEKCLKEFFGDDAAETIKRHLLKEQYEGIGLKFRSLP